jgi:hypothetical protein
MHHNRCVQTYYIIPILDYCLPPGISNIALKLHPHRAIIPAASQTTIYFAAGENKPPSLTQRNDFIHIHFIRHPQVSFEFLSLPALLTGVKGDDGLTKLDIVKRFIIKCNLN